MFGEKRGKGGEVTSFLNIHVMHQLAELRMGFDDRRRLSGIDEGCGKFTGMVDSQLYERKSEIFI